jgi:hypothetical protein
MLKKVVRVEPTLIPGKGVYVWCTLECGHERRVRGSRDVHVTTNTMLDCKQCKAPSRSTHHRTFIP